MRVVKQSTNRNVTVFMTDSTDHVSGKASLALTITASKDGAAFGSISPVVTELSNGWYKLALTTSHTDTLGDLALHITGTGADPTDLMIQVVAYDFADATSLGVSRIDAAISSRSTLTAALVWDYLTSAILTVGSIGKLIKDNLDAAITSRLSTLGYTTPDNTTITAINTKLGTPVATVSTDIANVKSDTSAIKITTDANLDSKVSATLTTGKFTALK